MEIFTEKTIKKEQEIKKNIEMNDTSEFYVLKDLIWFNPSKDKKEVKSSDILIKKDSKNTLEEFRDLISKMKSLVE